MHVKGFIHPQHVNGDVAAALRKLAVVTPALIKCTLQFYKKAYIFDRPEVWMDSKAVLLHKSNSLLGDDPNNQFKGITLRYTVSDAIVLVRLENIELNALRYIMRAVSKKLLSKSKMITIARQCTDVDLVTIPPTAFPTSVPSSGGHNDDDDNPNRDDD
jgi:hypothetical protein